MPYGKNSELPEPVKKALPAEAQSVFREAFNAFMEENPDAEEERAFQVAWGAVRRTWRKPEEEGGKWVKKDAADENSLVTDGLQIYDRIELDDGANVRITADGYMVAMPRVARTGIQLYRGSELGRPDMEVVRVYRPEAEVFHADSLASRAFRPVTDDHPPRAVNAGNWREFARGQTGGDVVRDGEFVRVPMVLMDKGLIGKVKEGKVELSDGYTTDLKWESGIAPDGQEYDAVQTAIRSNHLAVVKAARGGPKLRIGDTSTKKETDDMANENVTTMTIDGVTVQMNDLSAQVVARRIKQLEEAAADLRSRMEADLKSAREKTKEAEDSVAKLTAEIANKDAKIQALETKVKDSDLTPAKLDALVKDRAAAIEKAKAVLGDKLVVDGKSDAEIRRQVVEAKLGDAAKGYTDDQVKIAFDTLVATSVGTTQTDSIRQSFTDPNSSGHRPGPVITQQQLDAKYAARDQALEKAWMHPNGAPTQQ